MDSRKNRAKAGLDRHKKRRLNFVLHEINVLYGNTSVEDSCATEPENLDLMSSSLVLNLEPRCRSAFSPAIWANSTETSFERAIEAEAGRLSLIPDLVTRLRGAIAAL